jgi:galactokinase
MPVPDQPDSRRWSHAWSEDEGATRAWNLLRDTFGISPERQLSAPGMVNIVGDHTDYNRGLALPTVLPHRAYVAAAARTDGQVRIVCDDGDALPGPGAAWFGDIDDVRPGEITGWPARPASVLWALQERGYSGPGMSIAITSCVPRRSGMSSSAALSAAVSLAANELWGLALDTPSGRIELAEACVEGEAAFVGPTDGGAPSGGLDLHTVLRCPPGEAMLLDFKTSPPEALHTPMYFPEYGLSLLWIDTLVRPESNHEISAARRAECAAAARALGVASLRDLEDLPMPLREIERLEDPVLLRRARHVLHENDRVRLVLGELAGTGPAHERFVAVGKAMYRSHASLDVDFDLSSEILNVTVDAAFEAGALGAHLTGWGRGGAVLALVRRAEVNRIAAAVDAAYAARDLPLPQYAML